MTELARVNAESAAVGSEIMDRIRGDQRGVSEYDTWYAKTAREQVRLRAVEMAQAGLFPLVTVVEKFGDKKPKKLPLVPVDGSDREPKKFIETGFEPLYSESEFITPQGELRTYYGVGVGMIYGPAGSRAVDDRRLVEIVGNAFASMQRIIGLEILHQMDSDSANQR